jgi:hypothetical protein
MQENLRTTPTERAGLALLRPDHWRVGHRLIALVVAIALPLNLLIVAVIVSLASSSIELQRTSLLYTARSVASGVDAQLAKYMAIAADLQKSPALFADAATAFELEARQALTEFPMPGSPLAMFQSATRQYIDGGASLPRRGQKHWQPRRAIKTRSVIITGVGAAARWRLLLSRPRYSEWRAVSGDIGCDQPVVSQSW